ncbi:hypothetical protein [Thermostaphylospora chromogena]|uniref:Thioredoxin domain-containing protein n=1 Tax=Thermostaphylospora chromogena TaxID=35622 RepID=A0A1H1EF76_9ACTN|nr:hypothetical protein [Thermostaphylospora chromogena]SDQ87220.1 hypothetical protein SAMN04489764_2446 [Thermostaphylospora chromogena]
MSFLVALLTVVSAVHLMVTLALARTVRRLTRQVGSRPVILEMDETVGPFHALTTDGVRLDRAALPGFGMVAFFSLTCPSSLDGVDGFRSVAGRFPGGRDAVLAVLVGEERAAEPYARMLEPAARVVVEPERGALSRAFKVRGFPAYALVDATGRVLASGGELEEVFVIPQP